jgi:hypothetical protein
MRKIINSTYHSLDGDQKALDQWHFDTDDLRARFELTASEPLDTGVVVLTYRRARSPASAGPS